VAIWSAEQILDLRRHPDSQVDYDHPEKGDALYAFELSLSLEKLNNDRILELHRVAGRVLHPSTSQLNLSRFCPCYQSHHQTSPPKKLNSSWELVECGWLPLIHFSAQFEPFRH